MPLCRKKVMESIINHQLNESTTDDQFWERECKDVLVSYPSNEKHWPLNEEHVLETFSTFAEKYPKGCVSIEKLYFYKTPKIDKIILTIALDEWKGDKVVFSVEPPLACGFFYVICHLDVDHIFPLETISTYNCNVEDTLKHVEDFIKVFPKKRESMDRIAIEMKKEQEKENKLLEIAQKSIWTVIPSLMATTQYEWSLSFDEGRYILSIKTKKHKMIQISLTPKNFADKIPHILSIIPQIENLFEQIPFPIDIKTYGNNIKWHKGSDTVK